MRKTNNNALERNAAPVNIIQCMQCASSPISVRGGVWQTTCSTGITLEHAEEWKWARL